MFTTSCPSVLKTTYRALVGKKTQTGGSQIKWTELSGSFVVKFIVTKSVQLVIDRIPFQIGLKYNTSRNIYIKFMIEKTYTY